MGLGERQGREPGARLGEVGVEQARCELRTGVAFGPVSACPEVCVALIIWAPDDEVWLMLKVWVLVCDWLTPANEYGQLADHLIELDGVRPIRARLGHLGALRAVQRLAGLADHLGDYRLVERPLPATWMIEHVWLEPVNLTQEASSCLQSREASSARADAAVAIWITFREVVQFQP